MTGLGNCNIGYSQNSSKTCLEGRSRYQAGQKSIDDLRNEIQSKNIKTKSIAIAQMGHAISKHVKEMSPEKQYKAIAVLTHVIKTDSSEKVKQEAALALINASRNYKALSHRSKRVLVNGIKDCLDNVNSKIQTEGLKMAEQLVSLSGKDKLNEENAGIITDSLKYFSSEKENKQNTDKARDLHRAAAHKPHSAPIAKNIFET
ncbi:hypothetical protein ACFL52_02820 [Candidatus Margulisiibacteriota bacterium]